MIRPSSRPPPDDDDFGLFKPIWQKSFWELGVNRPGFAGGPFD